MEEKPAEWDITHNHVYNPAYLVGCLGCSLLAVHDLPNNHHHTNLLSFHQESLLRGLQDLVDLQGDHILLSLPLGFSGSSIDTEREKLSFIKMLKHPTNLGELTEVFINPPPWFAFHILNNSV